MGQERRRFTDEFKTEAIALLASSGRPLVQIARELGLSPSMLRNWRNRGAERHSGSALHPASVTGMVRLQEKRGNCACISEPVTKRQKM